MTTFGAAQTPSGLTDDIAPQPLAEALAAFASQTGLQLVYLSEIDTDQKSKGATAGLAPSVALTRLLAGTGLQFEFLNNRSVRIFAASYRPRPPVRPPAPSGRRADAPSNELEEVLVTATKREEVASEVPISMSVWTQEAMEVSGIKDLTDLAALTPGMYFSIITILGPGHQSSLEVRGVTRTSIQPTTGIYLDDTPIHEHTDTTGSYGEILPVTFDLERVEVLRGPQGTLGGDAALGGAVHFITNKPSLTDWSGLARSEMATTDHGAPSYEVGGAVGGPLVPDEIGFRIGAWSRQDGGYVDRVDPFTGAPVEADANYSRYKSIRGALLIAPTDGVRITPAFTYQSRDLNDTPVFYTALSDANAGLLKNGALLQQPYADAFYLASVKVTADFKGAELTAVTAYSRRHAFTVADFSPLPETYANLLRLDLPIVQRALSQEVRLTSSDPKAPFSWVAGAWFARSLDDGSGIVTLVENQTTSGIFESGRTTQIDGFGEVNLRTTNGLTGTVGVRVAHARYAGESAQGSPVNPPPPSASSAGETSVLPRFVLSRTSDRYGLFYLTIAKGYQLGGVNLPNPPPCPAPLSPTYGPDWVWNYELGTKERLLDGRLQLEASLFHMNWRNIQQPINPSTCGGQEVTNAGSAASNGFDLSVRAAITDRVRVAAALEYADARYTATVHFADGSVVHAGDVVGNLPNVAAPWSGNISADVDVFRTAQLTVNVRAEDVVRSHNTGPFALNAPSGPGYAPGLKADPATNLLNARIRFIWARYEVAAFIDNVFDSLPVLTALPDGVQGSSNAFAVTFRPRTIGLAGSVRF